jgi:lysophospholipid acyltransferase (LPLAT)-like uncharacterized protein
MSLLSATGKHLLPRLLKLWFSGLRVTVVMPVEPLPDPEKGFLFAFWHGKMVAGWLMTRNLFPGRSADAVVSLSKDGQLLSDTLETLGFGLIRGSSSKGGEEVKAFMLQSLRKGRIVAITPDGPRGPAYCFKYGTIRLASVHQIPLIFGEISYGKSLTLKSWDSFEIPLPFSGVTVTTHIIQVPGFESEEDLRDYVEKLSVRFRHE